MIVPEVNQTLTSPYFITWFQVRQRKNRPLFNKSIDFRFLPVLGSQSIGRRSLHNKVSYLRNKSKKSAVSRRVGCIILLKNSIAGWHISKCVNFNLNFFLTVA